MLKNMLASLSSISPRTCERLYDPDYANNNLRFDKVHMSLTNYEANASLDHKLILAIISY